MTNAIATARLARLARSIDAVAFKGHWMEMVLTASTMGGQPISSGTYNGEEVEVSLDALAQLASDFKALSERHAAEKARLDMLAACEEARQERLAKMRATHAA